jgi:uncharacterized protein
VVVGVISDTHGLLRPEVAKVFAGVRLILHAGDIGKAEIIEELNSIAPVVAVRGNNDTGAWARAIPETKLTKVDDIRIYMVHNVKDADFDPEDRRIQVIISGHSHRPSIETREGVLFMNPGSAGPRRFKLPITVGRLTIRGSSMRGEIINLLNN